MDRAIAALQSRNGDGWQGEQDLDRGSWKAHARASAQTIRLFRVTDTLVCVILAAAYLELIEGRLLEPQPPLALVLLVAGLLGQVLFTAAGLYDGRWANAGRAAFARITAATSLVGALLFLTAVPRAGPELSAMAAFWLITPVTIAAVRTGVAAGVRARVARATRNILIIGNGPRGQRLQHALQQQESARNRVVGFLDHADHPVPSPIARMTIGPPERLERILMRDSVDDVMIALPIRSCYAEIERAVRTCERMGVECRVLVDIFDGLRAAPRFAHDPSPMVTLPAVPPGYRIFLKRAFDLAGSSALLLLCLPLFLVIAAAIKATSRGPVFFVQDRYGFGRRRFRMLKFRSMVADAAAQQAELERLNEADGPLFKMRDDPRVTRVGRFLRSTSLDELPQLINVLLGDMSLVGPRPMALRDVALFPESSLMRRFSVKPGITGLWQVSGRSELGFQDWARLDMQYIDNWSFGLELKILWKTIPAVLSRRGAL